MTVVIRDFDRQIERFFVKQQRCAANSLSIEDLDTST
jgi:hypothetical protein